MIGFVGAHGNFLTIFKPIYYPYSNFLIAIYPLITGYAIIKHRLMDISLALTRTTIFLATYSVLLGMPFFIAFFYQNNLFKLFDVYWWIIPQIMLTISSVIGPIIFTYFQRKAEGKLLEEQINYQNTLQKASMGMGQIKDLNRLANLIVYIVVKAIKIEYCKIYLFNKEEQIYSLKSFKTILPSKEGAQIISLTSELVKSFKEKPLAIVYEDVNYRITEHGDNARVLLMTEIEEIKGEVFLPCFVEKNLVAIISLGKKKGGGFYNEKDLEVFSILANQAALAIENAMFYEDMKQTHEQIFKAEKMATIGTMADGLSHQINNRLHAMGFIAGDLLDSIKIQRQKSIPKESEELVESLEHAFNRIQDNVKKGGDIVQGLLKYTRKGEQGFSPIDLNELIDASLEMAQFKIKLNQISIKRDFPSDLPRIQGNFTQLQEAFFNMIDNAYDAMMERKSELKEEGYRPTLIFHVKTMESDQICIIIEDNGMGVQVDDQNKMFTPFFSTKAKLKKGTGLGMYVIRQLVEENHGGKIIFKSEYKKGSVQEVYLPTTKTVASG